MRKALLFVIATSSVAGMVAALDACGVDDLNLENRACPCGGGYICDTTRNICVKPELIDGAIVINTPPAPPPPPEATPCKGPDCACATETDCAFNVEYPKCGPAGKCVQCLATPDNCPVGSYCVADTNICAPGCKADSECVAISPTVPHCNAMRHQCVECATKTDCTGGKECTPSGVCTTGCFDGGPACPNGGSCCNGLCVDTKTDPANCNGCGLTCAGTALCCAGACTNPLTDKNNCGTCGYACSSTVNNTGSSCSSGRCQFTCTAGYGHCQSGNTGCESNLTNNSDRCGSCNTKCEDTVKHASGDFCQNSQCNYSTCNSFYYDKDGIRSNGCETSCGAAAQVCCPSGTACVVGQACEPLPAGDGKCH